MTDSPDDSHGLDPRRRAYGEPARRGGRRHRVGPAPEPVGFPSGGVRHDGWLRDLSPATLTSVAVGLIVVVVVGALTFFSTSRHPEPTAPADAHQHTQRPAEGVPQFADAAAHPSPPG